MLSGERPCIEIPGTLVVYFYFERLSPTAGTRGLSHCGSFDEGLWLGGVTVVVCNYTECCGSSAPHSKLEIESYYYEANRGNYR